MVTMRRILLPLLLIPFMAPACLGSGIVLNKPIPEIVLNDGRVLKNVVFVAVGSDTVIGKWDGGRGTIRLDLLPRDLGGGPPPAAAATIKAAFATTPVADFDKAKAPDAEMLADQSLAAEGGAALLALQAIRFQGEMGPPGEATPIVMVAAQPNYRRTEILLPQGRYIEGHGPKGDWYAAQKTGGTAVPATPAKKPAYRKTELDESFIEPLWRRKELGAQVEVVGQEQVTLEAGSASIRAYVLSETMPGGYRWDYLISSDDPTLPFIVKRTFRDGSIVGTEWRSRFRRIGALNLPMQYEDDGGDGRLVETRLFRAVVNPTVDASLFVVPATGGAGEANF